MARHDYSEDGDYFTQGFEKTGFVSIWLQLKRRNTDESLDALQDLCDVGYYKIDDQESNTLGIEAVVDLLLKDISYSASFSDHVVSKANAIGIASAYWVLAQFDFAYDPSRVARSISDDLVFIGVFPYAVSSV